MIVLVLVLVLVLDPLHARADTPVDRPEATELDRDTTPPGRVEFGFDGGAPIGAYALAASLGYLDHPLRLHTVEVRRFPVEHRETLALGGAVTLGAIGVADLRLPLSHQVGTRFVGLGDARPLDRWVPGDIALGLRVRVAARAGFSAFVRGVATFGTGDDHDFAGEAKWTAAWALIARGELGDNIVVAATGGIRLRGAEVRVADRVVGDELFGAAGVAVGIPPFTPWWCTPDQLRATAEIDGILGDRVGGLRGPSPVEMRIGVVGKPRPGFLVGVRVGAGLDDQVGAPRIRVLVDFAWQAPAAPPRPAPEVEDEE